ncbi:hypothetical protein WICMUC_000894 [Wickerhamomyces mucosus]|uniref:Sensitive to high expression protein 9, mitochondrial n=1 Tax=Wickerhamomyces mucosus TaxID=1378264 RepID=A0A9P8TI06_9ASCO|nr:hypothetical protein WICMUC_000894 [Wickerhamomyces mucosus]
MLQTRSISRIRPIGWNSFILSKRCLNYTTRTCQVQRSSNASKTSNKDEKLKNDNLRNGNQKNDNFPTNTIFSDQSLSYLAHLQSLFETSSKKVRGVIKPIKLHYNKARESIKKTNEKLAEQERESRNYAFKEDYSVENRESIEGLPSQKEQRRRLWAKRLELYMDSLQETIFTATRALNDVTGYSSIQKLRKSIEILERDLNESKVEARLSKENYNIAISRRLETQKEVNEMLQRKSSWSPTDLERFTNLYRLDHENANREELANQKLKDAETREEELQDKLLNAILTRYHEEQIWSDKIRRTSTWGTFGLMGMNILLFLVFQLLLEPWKRRRLVGNFEEKVYQALDENSKLHDQKLDIMKEKVENLTKSDNGTFLIKEINQTEINEDEEDLLSIPTIQALPLPQSQESTLKKIKDNIEKLIQSLNKVFEVMFHRNISEAVIYKNELVTTTSFTLGLGMVLGALLNIIF